jgi:tetratricopeptide (TPR) repeat protein
VLCIGVSLTAFGAATPVDEAKDMLARAEALYYEADFAKSIELLLRADELIRQESGHVQEKSDIKLQLALAYIGLNDRARAKDYLGELYALDSDHRIDPQLFSPKVIQLADEAKAEQDALRCRTVTDDAQRQLGAGNLSGVLKLIGANQAKCAGIASLNPTVAELFYKTGLDAYKKGQMELALQNFRDAVRLQPGHDLAVQYLDLTQSKLEVAADRALISWRKNFSSREFESASRDYRDVVSRSRPETIDEVRSEYRRALTALVDAWNRACAGNNTAAMEDVRRQVNELLPETSFAEDILANMKKCTPAGCIQMSAPLALARLRNRVDPQFPAFVVSQLKVSPITVHVKARISEKGDVAASEVSGGNPLLYAAVRDAFSQWKFSPVVSEGDVRCVDTDIPIVINISGK